MDKLLIEDRGFRQGFDGRACQRGGRFFKSKLAVAFRSCGLFGRALARDSWRREQLGDARVCLFQARRDVDVVWVLRPVGTISGLFVF